MPQIPTFRMYDEVDIRLVDIMDVLEWLYRVDTRARGLNVTGW